LGLSLGAALSGCGASEADSAATAMHLPDHVSDWTRQESSVTYDRETIFEYIDGAGEVYRSYAFRDVAVAHYTRSGSPGITVELFDMGTTEDAYGVFVHGREHEEAGIGGGFERRGGVLCFWQDRFYVCVAAEQPAAHMAAAVEEIARAIARNLPPPVTRPFMVDLLPPDGLVPFSDRFFHLRQSLNYHYYLQRENVLNLSAETDAVLARYAPGSTHLLIVRYESVDAAADALRSFREQYVRSSGRQTVVTERGTYVSSDVHDRFVAVVLDADSETAADALLEAATERIAQLGS
jgi:hypothetical protein